MGIKLAARVTRAALATGMAAGIFALSASQAMAWGDMYMGDGTNNPNSGTIFPYPSKANNCPSGLRPVVMNGVICCGTPTTTEYYYNAPTKRKVVHKRYKPRSYAPAGIKGVVYN